ncbi:MAG TPA: orotate phosphoribosyltransferase [Capsulimonadaceae bacterium]|nr:orotate phosphoribosyltransferase [Capsulimonadaceae bacterium]
MPLDLPAPNKNPLTNDDTLQIFKDAGALLDGHFLLTSGLHSPSYLEKFQVLQYPKYVEAMCAQIARCFQDREVETVLGPTTGGILLSYEVAKHLGTRGIFAEREGEGFALRRGFALKPGERVLVVDDILTTGGSVAKTVQVVRDAGAKLVGIGVLADRGGEEIDLGAPVEALLRLKIPRYAPEDCPLCRAGIPLTKRGSSTTSTSVPQ